MKEKTLEICRELAMSIWKKRYGKATKVKDFAGREMDKGAYDQRGSKFGWNLDHILPKSRGGKDTESNLICCHILTNDEKADKFPCFTANGKQFEIIKVENHYEIREKNDDSSKNASASNDEKKQDSGVNFYDYAAGLRCYETYAKHFWGSLAINLNNPKSAAIVDFIKELFDDTTIVTKYNTSNENLLIRVTGIKLPSKDSVQELRNKCMILNSYLGSYFLRKKLISDYFVFCEAHDQEDELKCIESPNNFKNQNYYFVINEIIKMYSDANDKFTNSDCIGKDSLGYRVYSHNWWWTRLKENLERN